MRVVISCWSSTEERDVFKNLYSLSTSSKNLSRSTAQSINYIHLLVLGPVQQRSGRLPPSPKAPRAAVGLGVMLRHSFGDGSPSAGCCIGGESPPLVSCAPFFLLRAERVRVGPGCTCVRSRGGWGVPGNKLCSDPHTQFRPTARARTMAVCRLHPASTPPLHPPPLQARAQRRVWPDTRAPPPTQCSARRSAADCVQGHWKAVLGPALQGLQDRQQFGRGQVQGPQRHRAWPRPAAPSPRRAPWLALAALRSARPGAGLRSLTGGESPVRRPSRPRRTRRATNSRAASPPSLRCPAALTSR